MISINNVKLMYSKVFELEEIYLFAKNYILIHWVSFEQILKIITFIKENVLKWIENVR